MCFWMKADGLTHCSGVPVLQHDNPHSKQGLSVFSSSLYLLSIIHEIITRPENTGILAVR